MKHLHHLLDIIFPDKDESIGVKLVYFVLIIIVVAGMVWPD
ncbi:MAG: hypothetical protein ACXWEY_16540 [Bacteroidia bacterium]